MTLQTRKWYTQPGVMLLIAMFTYHGATEIIQAAYPWRNVYRYLTNQSALDYYIVIVTFAVILYGTSYCLAKRLSFRRAAKGQPQNIIQEVPSALSWKIWLPLAAVLYAITTKMLFFDPSPSSNYWTSGLTSQFSSILLTVSALGIISSVKRRFRWVIFLAYIFLLLPIASRFTVIASVIMLISIMRRHKMTFTRKQLGLIVITAIIGMISISMARSIVGRDQLSGTFSNRIGGIIKTVSFTNNNEFIINAILNDTVYRLDANSYDSYVFEQQCNGSAFAGFKPLWNNFLLCIPSFISPRKLDSNIEDRDEETFMDYSYGLNANRDYTPGLFGIVLGMGGIWTMYVFSVCLGLFYGKLDRWCNNNYNVASELITIGMMTTALLYEQAVTIYFVTARGLLFIFVVATSIQAVRTLAKQRATFFRRTQS